MLILFVWQLPSLPGGLPPSTIGVRRLNFCVRYGDRCIPSAIVTRYLIYCFYLIISSKYFKTFKLRLTTSWRVLQKPDGLV